MLYLPKIWAFADYSVGTGPATTEHVMQCFQMTLNMGNSNQLTDAQNSEHLVIGFQNIDNGYKVKRGESAP